MRTRLLSTVAIACLLVLAGCSGAGPASGTDTATDAGATPTTDAPAADATATDTPTASAAPSPTATPTDGPTATATTTETETPVPWTHPEIPNKPMEDKTDAEPGERIRSVEFVDTVAADNGSGYSDFDLRIHANTSMERVDPASHGTVEGEPYFLLYVNEQLLERSDYVLMDSDGTFNLTVRESGLERFDESDLDLTLKLVDRDSEYDDVYGVWNGTVRYSPD